MTQLATARWPGIAHTPRTPLKARAARAILRPTAKHVPVRLTFSDGTVWGAGDASSPEMRIVRPKAFFARLGAGSKIGFGEAYMAGDWTAGPDTDLADLLRPFAERMATIVPVPLQKFRVFVDEKLPHQQRNSLTGSKKNIEAHYDLSNDLFAQFLDPSMSYSAAWFATPDQDLEAAQMHKIDGILDQAGVTAGTRLLEIGSGWGALAIRAAQRGADVTTITLSKEQAVLAEERFADAGVEVDLRLMDYREVTGQYDAIVSVEMIEAVGEEYWPTYFATIDRLLAPGGKVSIQAITMAHHRYLATRDSYGWIQKYIFPGGLIPSLEAIDHTLADHTTLAVTDQRSLGQDYARTLRQWRERFNANWATIHDQGFDETFRRMWEFYLAYCEAGFAAGYIDVFQLRMSRPSEV
ncbi:methyltransferase domain-containing protein [Aeromicrobium sp. SMF47]|uniref:SAM-dependent methyltransferase n=1 Tax=Aeromicrobium TaxID=2040 RepID=UPI00129E6F3A|nr:MULTISPECIES: cyclopropane-fatty-acyl-phospholipid synthase family protein [Aeromicrobium]MRJ77913.1 methyltransferase domain-containing protein [Aeromicrobium yanjiei]MRK02273.1 methyltransferase domain-containing protein [Aeromicrobium sp. S22]